MPIPMSVDEIVADLADRIRDGEYRAGEQMPTYQQLANMYSVSEGTIYFVIKILKDRGVLVGRRGRGTFVPEE